MSTVFPDRLTIGDLVYAMLFAETGGSVAAFWFSGFIHGWRGDARYTGYPTRKFRNDEIVRELRAGMVI